MHQAEQASGEDPEDTHLLLEQVDHVPGDQGGVAADIFILAVVPWQFRRHFEQTGVRRRREDPGEWGFVDHFQRRRIVVAATSRRATSSNRVPSV